MIEGEGLVSGGSSEGSGGSCVRWEVSCRFLFSDLSDVGV